MRKEEGRGGEGRGGRGRGRPHQTHLIRQYLPTNQAFPSIYVEGSCTVNLNLPSVFVLFVINAYSRLNPSAQAQIIFFI